MLIKSDIATAEQFVPLNLYYTKFITVFLFQYKTDVYYKFMVRLWYMSPLLEEKHK